MTFEQDVQFIQSVCFILCILSMLEKLGVVAEVGLGWW